MTTTENKTNNINNLHYNDHLFYLFSPPLSFSLFLFSFLILLFFSQNSNDSDSNNSPKTAYNTINLIYFNPFSPLFGTKVFLPKKTTETNEAVIQKQRQKHWQKSEISGRPNKENSHKAVFRNSKNGNFTVVVDSFVC